MRPTRPAVGNGNCANASAMMLMWSVVVLLPALPGRNAKANGSPVPAWPWSTNAQNGWCPKPFLYVGAACSFSECAVTSVASRSMISGFLALMSWSGAWAPAWAHAIWRAVARAVLMARNAVGASAARVVNSRDTVGSEATDPNTPGSSRSRATSARQSPPNATATARSSTILPESWVAKGLRHGDSAAESPAVKPVFSAVRNNVIAPACDTTPVPVVSTDSDG